MVAGAIELAARKSATGRPPMAVAPFTRPETPPTATSPAVPTGFASRKPTSKAQQHRRRSVAIKRRTVEAGARVRTATPKGLPTTAPASKSPMRRQSTCRHTLAACMTLALTSSMTATATGNEGGATSDQLATRIAEKPKPE